MGGGKMFLQRLKKSSLLVFLLLMPVLFGACMKKEPASSDVAGLLTPTPYVQETEIYSGPVEHVFTHSLIAYPELAYTNTDMKKRKIQEMA